MAVFYPKCRAVLNVVFDGFSGLGSESAPVVIPVRPQEAVIHRNSYRQADSWELTIPASDFPIDPQLIRTMACEIYMYQTPDMTDVIATKQTSPNQTGADPFAEWVAGQLNRLGEMPRPQIAGLADEVNVEYSTGGKTVRITGQDYTDYLIARQWAPNANGTPRRIPIGKRLDLLMKEVLAEADPKGRLRLDIRGVDADAMPVVKETSLGNARGIPVQTDTSYFDVLYGLASRYGYICFIQGLDLVLTRPQNFSSEYRGRPLRLTWGRNIESLEMTRSMSKEKVPQIVVVGYDPRTRKRVTVSFPKAKQKVPPPGTVGANDDEYQVVPVLGTTNEATLRAMAENLFNLIGRGERTVRLTTKDLKDSENADGNDILNASVGTPVIIDFDEFNVNEALLADEKKPEAAKYQHLVEKGYSEAVAAVLAQHYTKLQALSRPMRIKEISFSYSVTDGISIEAELNDYVVIGGERG